MQFLIINNELLANQEKVPNLKSRELPDKQSITNDLNAKWGQCLIKVEDMKKQKSSDYVCMLDWNFSKLLDKQKRIAIAELFVKALKEKILDFADGEPVEVIYFFHKRTGHAMIGESNIRLLEEENKNPSYQGLFHEFSVNNVNELIYDIIGGSRWIDVNELNENGELLREKFQIIWQRYWGGPDKIIDGFLSLREKMSIAQIASDPQIYIEKIEKEINMYEVNLNNFTKVGENKKPQVIEGICQIIQSIKNISDENDPLSKRKSIGMVSENINEQVSAVFSLAT